MKKETLLEIILGTIGGLIFAIGMCMCLIPEWDLLKAGIVVAFFGIIVLLFIIPIYRKEHPKKEHRKINWNLALAWIIGVVGSLIMGYGMSKIMVEEATKMDMIVGMITGVVGLIICVLNYPIYSYINADKE